MELRTQRAESRAEPDSNQETPPTWWVGELDNMCSKRLQNCYGPNYSIASYYSIFEWGYLLELPSLCFDIVCFDIVWFSLQAEVRGNKQSPGLAGLEGKSDLWLKICYLREMLSVWKGCRSQDHGFWAWCGHWVRLQGSWEEREYFTHGRNVTNCGQRVALRD